MAGVKKTNQSKLKGHGRAGSNTSSPNKRAENWNFTHVPPTNAQRTVNGRQKGRDLVSWARKYTLSDVYFSFFPRLTISGPTPGPRMMEQTMLHLVYEATTRNIRLPWDNIAHRLHPGLSGNALLQRFQRLRRELIAEGHLVPPLPGRGNSNIDPEIRGLTRLDRDGPDLETTREVRFDEPWLAPQFNLPDAGKLVHNQTERRGKTTKDATAFQLGSDDEDSDEKDFDAIPSDDGAEDDSDEDEEYAKPSARRNSVAHRRQTSRSLKKKSYAEIDSGDEYAGSNKKKTTDSRRRGDSSSPLNTRKDKFGRRSTMGGATSSNLQTAISSDASQSSNSASGDAVFGVPGLTFGVNYDGSFSVPTPGDSSQSTNSSSMNLAAMNHGMGGLGAAQQGQLLNMYQLLQAQIMAQQGMNAPGLDLSQLNAIAGQFDGSAGRPSIFTGQHFGRGQPTTGETVATGDVTMGGMGASQAKNPNGAGQFNSEQHRLAMAILNNDSAEDPPTPTRRSRRQKRGANGETIMESIEVKTEEEANPAKRTPLKTIPKKNGEDSDASNDAEDDLDMD